MEIIGQHLPKDMAVAKNESIDIKECVSLVDTKDNVLTAGIFNLVVNEYNSPTVDTKSNVLDGANVKNEIGPLVDSEGKLDATVVKIEPADVNVKTEDSSSDGIQENEFAFVNVKNENCPLVDTKDNEFVFVIVKTETDDAKAESDNVTDILDNVDVSTVKQETDTGLTMTKPSEMHCVPIPIKPADKKLKANLVEVPSESSLEKNTGIKPVLSRYGKIRCKHCYTYFTEDKLRSHRIIYNLGKSHLTYVKTRSKSLYTCKICQMGFTKKFHFQMHKNIHMTKRLYCCDVCNDSFNAKSKLRTHIKAEHSTIETPHRCDVCNKTFTHIFSLISHMKVHAT